MFIASWESRRYLYQGFGPTRESAIRAALAGYRKNVRRMSNQTLTKHEVEVFLQEVHATQVKSGHCLIDHGSGGWI